MNALDLRRRMRFSVIPLVAKDQPKIKWKQYQTKLPEEQLVLSWGDGMYAIVTGEVSNIVVVDLDDDDAIAWAEQYLPTPCFRTQTAKGQHWFYRHPGVEVRNKAKLQINGVKTNIDIRADGGYVVGPGSVHETGVIYEALGSWTPKALLEGPVFDPEWVAEPEPVRGPIMPSSTKTVAPTTDVDRLRFRHYLSQAGPAIEGMGGDHHTYKCCCAAWDFIDKGLLTESEAREELNIWDATNSPSWGPAGIDRKFYASAGKYRQGGRDVGDTKATDSPDYCSEDICFSGVPKPVNERPADFDKPDEEQEEAWPEPDYISINRPDFPVDRLPGIMGDIVRETARSTQTPPSLAACLALSAVSLCALKRFHLVVIEGSWTEYLCLYTVSAADPGTRKSAVFNLVTKPIIARDIREIERAKQAKLSNKDVIEHKLEMIKGNRREAAKYKESQCSTYFDANRQFQEQIEQLKEEGKAKILVTDDITAESLVQELELNNGRLGNFSSEGDLFKILAGRYSDGKSNFAAFLKAYTGDYIRVNRKNKDPITVTCPLLTLGLMTQPSIIGQLRHNSEMRDTGLLARFLYAIPPSNVGGRMGVPGPAKGEVVRAWDSALRRILSYPEDDMPMYLSKPACEALFAWKDAIEERMGLDGDLYHMRDWASKIVGTTARVACLMHLVSSEPGQAVGEHVVKDAIAITEEFWIPHSTLALGQVSDFTLLDDCVSIIQAVLSGNTSMGEVRRARRRRFKDAKERFDEAMLTLSERKFLFIEEVPVGPKGGRPTERLVVNKLLKVDKSSDRKKIFSALQFSNSERLEEFS